MVPNRATHHKYRNSKKKISWFLSIWIQIDNNGSNSTLSFFCYWPWNSWTTDKTIMITFLRKINAEWGYILNIPKFCSVLLQKMLLTFFSKPKLNSQKNVTESQSGTETKLITRLRFCQIIIMERPYPDIYLLKVNGIVLMFLLLPLNIFLI